MKKQNMDRSEFLKKIVRALLFILLAVVGFLLSSKSVKGTECSKCSGYGKCSGETDCFKFKNENEGR